MTIERRFCAHHPDRPAIGVCVMTAQPICGECSTRYEGVNYSKEGLAMLLARRQAATRRGPWQRVVAVAAIVLTPMALGLLLLAWGLAARLVIDLTRGAL